MTEAFPEPTPDQPIPHQPHVEDTGYSLRHGENPGVELDGETYSD